MSVRRGRGAEWRARRSGASAGAPGSGSLARAYDRCRDATVGLSPALTTRSMVAAAPRKTAAGLFRRHLQLERQRAVRFFEETT